MRFKFLGATQHVRHVLVSRMDMPFVGEHFEAWPCMALHGMAKGLNDSSVQANAATPPENISHGSAMHGTGSHLNWPSKQALII